MATKIDLTGKTSRELQALWQSGDNAMKDAVTAEFDRRDGIVSAAGKQVSVFVTSKRGIFVKNLTLSAPSENAKSGEYCPSVTFATREQLADILTPGTATHTELQAILAMSADDFAKAAESHAAKKLDRANKDAETAAKSAKAARVA